MSGRGHDAGRKIVASRQSERRLRYVLEGEWTGYVPAQSKVVYREIVHSKVRADRLRLLHKIVYTDGTELVLSVRELKPRERVAEIRAYASLIAQAEKVGVPATKTSRTCP